MWFRQGVHCVAVGRDLVVLDLLDDAYFCIADGFAQSEVFDGDIATLAPDLRRILADAGLATFDPAQAGLRPSASLPPLPVRDLRHLDRAAVTPGRALDVVASVMALRDMGENPAVSRLLTFAATQCVSPDVVADRSRLIREAAVFAQMLPWLPGRHLCLQRAALLMGYLRRRALGADWVFGVRTWPFRAHCWLQTGDLCLNDDVERLRAYTPIFALMAGMQARKV